MADYKNKLIQEFLTQPFVVGELVLVNGSYIERGSESMCHAYISKINDDNTCEVKDIDRAYKGAYTVPTSVIAKDTSNVGVNPFVNISFWDKFRNTEYDIMGILLYLNIEPKDSHYSKECYVFDGFEMPYYNDNPYVIDKKGNKQYYQRDYVWTIEDERSFIDSLYNGISCGKLVVRQRSWEWLESEIKKGNREVAFCDIVDGKQRIHTIKRFINDEFTDNNGHYYSDFSKSAQRYFMSTRNLSLTFMKDNVTDEDVIKSFLMVNFAGKPMSKEHIEYIKTINI